MSLLFLGKAGDPHTLRAADFCRLHEPSTYERFGEWGEPIPQEFGLTFDYIISYCSRWIVPEVALKRTRKMALNFHPGPPEYPGFAPICHALYEQDDTFGVTCHRMAPKVDSGAIVWVDNFPIYPADTVATLMDRTQVALEAMFYRVMDAVFAGRDLRQWFGWARQPYTKRELEELSTLTPEMSETEMRRRIRAVTYDKWRAKMMINGITLEVVE